MDVVLFRCLDDGHLLEEVRKATGPLAVRQSTWCVAHDCPAVSLGASPANEREGAATD